MHRTTVASGLTQAQRVATIQSSGNSPEVYMEDREGKESDFLLMEMLVEKEGARNGGKKKILFKFEDQPKRFCSQ